MWRVCVCVWCVGGWGCTCLQLSSCASQFNNCCSHCSSELTTVVFCAARDASDLLYADKINSFLHMNTRTRKCHVCVYTLMLFHSAPAHDTCTALVLWQMARLYEHFLCMQAHKFCLLILKMLLVFICQSCMHACSAVCVVHALCL